MQAACFWSRVFRFPNGGFSVEYIRVFYLFLEQVTIFTDRVFQVLASPSPKFFFCVRFIKKVDFSQSIIQALWCYIYIIDWCNAMSDQNSFRLWTLKKNSTGFDIDSLNIMQQNWQNVEFLDTKKFALIFGITRTRYSQDLTLIR